MEKGYIYLIRTTGMVGRCENVYKVGRTSREIEDRLNEYEKGMERILTIKVSNNKEAETKIIKELKEKYKQRNELGNEYFEGDIHEIIITIVEICKLYKEDNIREKEYVEERFIYNILNECVHKGFSRYIDTRKLHKEYKKEVGKKGEKDRGRFIKKIGKYILYETKNINGEYIGIKFKGIKEGREYYERNMGEMVWEYEIIEKEKVGIEKFMEEMGIEKGNENDCIGLAKCYNKWKKKGMDIELTREGLKKKIEKELGTKCIERRRINYKNYRNVFVGWKINE